MVQQQLSDGNPDGVNMGQSTSDLIGFYGLSTNIAQPTGAAIGTDAATTQTLANAMKVTLDSLGLQSTV
jgi:hypothetical protein